MAYMSKEHKARIANELKSALKGTGVKCTLAIRHHSTIVCTVKSAPIDLIGNWCEQTGKNRPAYLSVNHYHYNNYFTGKALEIVDKIIKCLNINNWNNSRPEYDHFDVGHYISLNIGKYNKPFEVK